jgi:hypothetical protein
MGMGVLFFGEVNVVEFEVVDDQVGWDVSEEGICSLVVKCLFDLLPVSEQDVDVGRDEFIWDVFQQEVIDHFMGYFGCFLQSSLLLFEQEFVEASVQLAVVMVCLQ